MLRRQGSAPYPGFVKKVLVGIVVFVVLAMGGGGRASVSDPGSTSSPIDLPVLRHRDFGEPAPAAPAQPAKPAKPAKPAQPAQPGAAATPNVLMSVLPT